MKILISCLILLLISAPGFASTVSGNFDFLKARCQSLDLTTNLQSEKYHWFEPRLQNGEKMKAVVLSVHGLNNRAAVMLPLVQVLNQQGIGVLNVELTGYAGQFSNLQKVTANDWLKDVFVGNCLLQTKAQGLSEYYMGFSLGGLIGETLMSSPLSEKFEFEKVLLFSPAMTVRDRSHWIRLFSFLGRESSMISFAPKRYAAYRFTPNAAYESLFDLTDFFADELVQDSQKVNVPTLIFADPKDELVSTEYLDEMIGVRGLDQWQLHLIHKDETAQTWFHHVTIDEHAVGKTTWAMMLSQIQNFLK